MYSTELVIALLEERRSESMFNTVMVTSEMEKSIFTTTLVERIHETVTSVGRGTFWSRDSFSRIIVSTWVP